MRSATALAVLVLLYPWIVGFDSSDSLKGSWSVAGAVGHGGYHQVERDCYPVTYSPGEYADSITVDRAAPFTDAALEVRHSDSQFDFGARAGLLSVRDNRYLFDTDRFMTLSIMDAYGPRQATFDRVTMYYANPFFSIHGSRRSFSGHFNLGFFFGTVAGVQSSAIHLTGGGGLQIDSSFFLDLSLYEGMPLVSDGGPVQMSIGTSIHSWNNTMLWFGGGLGTPYHDGVAFVRTAVPLSDRIHLAVTLAAFSSSEWSVASGLRYEF